MNTHILRDCQVQSLFNALHSGRAKAGYEDAQQRFNIFHILNYIMYTDAITAFDKMEEVGLMRNDAKRRRKHCDKIWGAYQSTLRKSMKDDAWYLMQDYMMAAYESVETKLMMMRVAFHNYLLKRHIEHADVIATLSCAIKIGELITTLWTNYFAAYKRVTGLDFQHDFAYADMRIVARELRAITCSLLRNDVIIHYDEDKACEAAQNAVEYHLANDDFMEKASRQALSLSDKYKPLLQEIEEGERAKQEQELITRLSTKFDKVRKL